MDKSYQDAESSQVPQALADMRNVWLGYIPDSDGGRALQAMLQKNPDKFIQRWDKLEMDYSAKSGAGFDNGSEEALGVLDMWLKRNVE